MFWVRKSSKVFSLKYSTFNLKTHRHVKYPASQIKVWDSRLSISPLLVPECAFHVGFKILSPNVGWLQSKTWGNINIFLLKQRSIYIRSLWANRCGHHYIYSIEIIEAPCVFIKLMDSFFYRNPYGKLGVKKHNLGHTIVSGKFLSIVGQAPVESKSHWLHVDIFSFVVFIWGIFLYTFL
jgi:hypothetical protein